jgi:uncharacterized damage-inducible protein DinB
MVGGELGRRETEMTSGEREVLLKNLAESRERLLRMARGLSCEQWHYRAAPGRWTVAECVEHIAFVETRILRAIQKTLQTGPDASKRSGWEGKEEEMLADVAGRVTRFPAPEMVVPTGRWPEERLLEEFEGARERTREFAASTEADLRQHFFQHPVFGELDLYQWLMLLAAHCDRHREQSEEVMNSPGFPGGGRRATTGA